MAVHFELKDGVIAGVSCDTVQESAEFFWAYQQMSASNGKSSTATARSEPSAMPIVPRTEAPRYHAPSSRKDRELAERSYKLLTYLRDNTDRPVYAESLKQVLGLENGRALSGTRSALEKLLRGRLNVGDVLLVSEPDARGYREWSVGPRVDEAIAILKGPEQLEELSS